MAETAIVPVELWLCQSAVALALQIVVGEERWGVGQVELLQPEDEEPFILASVKTGQARMAVDTYMFKTGGPAHKKRSPQEAHSPIALLLQQAEHERL
jgi:hypothetical protein